MAQSESNIASEAVAAAVVSATSVPSTDVEQWTLTEVCGWLSANGFPHDVEERFREHEVTGDVLLSLSEEDLGKLGIKFGLCRRLSLRVSKLRGGAPAGCSQQSINNACEPLSKGELRTSIQSGQPNKRVLRPSHSAPASFQIPTSQTKSCTSAISRRSPHVDVGRTVRDLRQLRPL